MYTSVPKIPPPFSVLEERIGWKNVTVEPPGKLPGGKYNIEMNGPFMFFFDPKNKGNMAFWIFLPMFSPQPVPNKPMQLIYVSLNAEEKYLMSFSTKSDQDSAFNKYIEVTIKCQETISTIPQVECQNVGDVIAFLLNKNRQFRAQIVLQTQNSKYIFQAHEQNANGSFQNAYNHIFTGSTLIGSVSKIPSQFGSPNLIPQMFMIKDSHTKSPQTALFLTKSLDQAILWVLDCYRWIDAAVKSHKMMIMKNAQQTAKPATAPKTPLTTPPQPLKTVSQPQTQNTAPVQQLPQKQLKQPVNATQTTVQQKSDTQQQKLPEKQEKENKTTVPTVPTVPKEQKEIKKTNSADDQTTQQTQPTKTVEQKTQQQQQQSSVQQTETTKTPEPFSSTQTKQETTNTVSSKIPETQEQQTPETNVANVAKPKIQITATTETKETNVANVPKPKIQITTTPEPKETNVAKPKIQITTAPETKEAKTEEKPKPKARIQITTTKTTNITEQTRNQSSLKILNNQSKRSVRRMSGLIEDENNNNNENDNSEAKAEEPRKQFCVFPKSGPLKDRLSKLRSSFKPREEKVFKQQKLFTLDSSQRELDNTKITQLLNNCVSVLSHDVPLTKSFCMNDAYFSSTNTDIYEQTSMLLQPQTSVNIESFVPFNDYPTFSKDALIYSTSRDSAFLLEITNIYSEMAQLTKIESSPCSDKLCFVVSSIFTNGLRDDKTLFDVIRSLCDKFTVLNDFRAQKLNTNAMLEFGQLLINTQVVIPLLRFAKSNKDFLKLYKPSALLFDDNLDFVETILNKIMLNRTSISIDSTKKSNISTQLKSELSEPENIAAEIDTILLSDAPTNEECADIFERLLKSGSKSKLFTFSTFGFLADLSEYIRDPELKEEINKRNKKFRLNTENTTKELALVGSKKRFLHIWFSEIALSYNTQDKIDVYTDISPIRNYGRLRSVLCSLSCLMSKMGPPETI